ncbi:MAG: sel1 repeat family protein [Rickettsiaceae bacterium]|nr:sel1 repeat family protein [Rickettsiaceae bacterium]
MKRKLEANIDPKSPEFFYETAKDAASDLKEAVKAIAGGLHTNDTLVRLEKAFHKINEELPYEEFPSNYFLLNLGYQIKKFLDDIQINALLNNIENTTNKTPGVNYLIGLFNLHLSEDPSKSLRYLLIAGEQGHVLAQDMLGDIYQTSTNDFGVEKDDKEAVKWYTLAAEQGDLEAQAELSLIYCWGDKDAGIEKDCKKAKELAKKAADCGYEHAIEAIASMYGNKDLIEPIKETCQWFIKIYSSKFKYSSEYEQLGEHFEKYIKGQPKESLINLLVDMEYIITPEAFKFTKHLLPQRVKTYYNQHKLLFEEINELDSEEIFSEAKEIQIKQRWKFFGAVDTLIQSGMPADAIVEIAKHLPKGGLPIEFDQTAKDIIGKLQVLKGVMLPAPFDYENYFKTANPQKNLEVLRRRLPSDPFNNEKYVNTPQAEQFQMILSQQKDPENFLKQKQRERAVAFSKPAAEWIIKKQQEKQNNNSIRQ